MPKTLREYQDFCKLTAKKFDDRQTEILTWGLGITGEAGDVASCIKKTFIHENDQTQGIKENLGDTLWYAAMICNYFGWSLQEILESNAKKLEDRYPSGFDLKKAKRNGKRIDWSK
ncbi:MAG: nucleoside triphosphate pyrophosphohydrolase family protein [Candidatus Diapherotrites archaeon]|nr:nucleoside triphosphate pyrophosphohydrolase family protein [Candidatus Diapherotrites archaeon]